MALATKLNYICLDQKNALNSRICLCTTFLYLSLGNYMSDNVYLILMIIASVVPGENRIKAQHSANLIYV